MHRIAHSSKADRIYNKAGDSKPVGKVGLAPVKVHQLKNQFINRLNPANNLHSGRCLVIPARAFL
jgi:hypothetical protein